MMVIIDDFYQVNQETDKKYSRMEFPTLNNKTTPFPFLMLCGIFFT